VEAYAEGQRSILERTPERVAQEVRQDAPMTTEHAPPTREIPRTGPPVDG
jgi:hypothetical protein